MDFTVKNRHIHSVLFFTFFAFLLSGCQPANEEKAANQAPELHTDLSQQELAFIENGTVPLGLPPVEAVADNPITVDKFVLGERLFFDTRFSADGKVSCGTCHAEENAFTDNLKVSKGFNDLTGTRNAPTVVNSAYTPALFWDGREPTLESQSLQPPINPVEGGLPNHNKIIEVVKNDQVYVEYFQKVFGIAPDAITMKEISQAIAAYERVQLRGNSRFDQYYFGKDKSALTTSEINGFDVFLNKGRCVSCHTIEQDHALFTDNRFHNIGVGFKSLQGKEQEIISTFIEKKRGGEEVDIVVLTDAEASELGRFAVSEKLSTIGAFKTPTVREIASTAPYMHDGSIKTLAEVIDFYNNGGRLKESAPLSDHLSGGIKPLDLTVKEKRDLISFLEALSSTQELN